VIKTNTIWFRLALSASALWLAVAGYFAISKYDDLNSVPKLTVYDSDDYKNCDTKLDVERMQLRQATTSELDECHAMYVKIYRDIEAKRSWSEIYWNETTALKEFFYWGVLPVAGLLLIVMLWEYITKGFSIYLAWLKGNSERGES